MLSLVLLILLFKGIQFQEINVKFQLTTVTEYPDDDEGFEEDMSNNIAGFNDAQHRGEAWYDQVSTEDAYKSDLDDGLTETESDKSDKDYSDSGQSSDASSQETKERRMVTRLYRECTPCPEDMLKSFKNRGIKWICGSYQRARRSFKSPCMLRYRNCQDGTMFVKIADHRCENSSYHGRHWFYIYRT